MKKLLPLLFLSFVLLIMIGCDKTDDGYPQISFKTSSGFVQGYSLLSPGQNYTIGIVMKKSLQDHKLKTFRIERSFNDSAATLLFEKAIPADSNLYYYYEFKNKTSTIVGRKTTFAFTAVADNNKSNTIISTHVVQ